MFKPHNNLLTLRSHRRSKKTLMLLLATPSAMISEIRSLNVKTGQSGRSMMIKLFRFIQKMANSMLFWERPSARRYESKLKQEGTKACRVLENPCSQDWIKPWLTI